VRSPASASRVAVRRCRARHRREFSGGGPENAGFWMAGAANGLSSLF
jgi:hypothetical protein